MSVACRCPRIDGFIVIGRDCPHHEDARRRRAAAPEPVVEVRDADADDLACGWSDYRKDYGVSADEMTAAYKAFRAGWKAAREGDQSGVLR